MVGSGLLWWISTGALLVVELTTGTFYLLMIALGCAAGGLAHLLGMPAAAQLVLAALVALAAVAVLRRSRYGSRQRRGAKDATRDADVLLDIGQTVRVEHWEDGPRRKRARALVCDLPGAGQPAYRRRAAVRPFFLHCLTGHYFMDLSIIALVLFIVVVVIATQCVKITPQQHAWVLERLGRYHATLTPGLNIVLPFVDRVAYKHSLKEIPLDVPPQVCITRDNTQLQVDGVLYFQVTDPMKASYGSANYMMAITQLAQTMLRSVIGKMELDKTFEERDLINHSIVSALDDAAANWGVKVLRYEIKDLTPPKEILHAMQAQITAEREKRALIAASEGRKQEQINLASGAREAAIQKSEGEKQAAINQAQGQAAAILAVAEANAQAIQKIADAMQSRGGMDAVNLKVAEQYVNAFGNLAKQGNTLIVPANLSEMSTMIASALSIVQAKRDA
ncbi:Stomatin-like protein 2, mitochondrial [Apophysomyces sp. BC1015]|nr:Stomatin-like protein 2, mitochondrial [Apophysomyces sp. BC1015]